MHKRGARGAQRLVVARLCAALLACASVIAVLVAARAAESSAPPAASPAASPVAAQRARQRRPTQRRRTQPRRAAVDYSKFNHSTAEHRSPRRECSSCHVIPALPGAGAVDFAKQQPARLEVTDFPDHPSCVECHRQQFFRGARPVICSNCHTVTGPRSEARFKFPKPSEAPEFADVFPHNVHTDQKGLKAFRNPIILGQVHQNETCGLCHKLDAREFKSPAPAASPRTATASATASPAPAAAAVPAGFILPGGTFMITQTSHATCFQCHWQESVEGRNHKIYAKNCDSCHDNTALRARAVAGPVAAAATTTPAVTSTPAASPAPSPARPAVPAALVVPASFQRFRPTREDSWPVRISPAFTHTQAAHSKRVGADGKEVPFNCTTCHTAVRKENVRLEDLKKKEHQVKLQTCATAACHTAPAQETKSVYSEMVKRNKDPKFACVFCHAPPTSTGEGRPATAIGKAEIPCDHWEAVYETAKQAKRNIGPIERQIRESKRCLELLPK